MAKKKVTKKTAKKASKSLFLVLVGVTGVDLGLFTDEQDVLTDITTRIDAFSDDVWKKLPKAAQEWYNGAAAAVEDDSSIPLPDGIADWLDTVAPPSDDTTDDVDDEEDEDDTAAGDEPDADDEDEDLDEDEPDSDDEDEPDSDVDEDSDESTAEAGVEDKPKKRGATVRFRELMVQNPTWTKEEVIAAVEAEGFAIAESTSGAIWYHTEMTIGFLEAAGRLKPVDATPAKPEKVSKKAK